MITPETLRKLTNDALLTAEKERVRQAEAALRQAEETQRKNEGHAAAVLAEIPLKVHKAAVEGKSSIDVMRLEYSEYNRPAGVVKFDFCRPEWLEGAAKIVWDHCVAAKLKLTLEHWHDGVGIHESFDIVVHW